MKKKLIIFYLIILFGVSYSNEKYSLFFTDVRYNRQLKKFYFLKYDLLENDEYKTLERYVKGDFEGKKIIKITKYYKGQIQNELILNDDGVCIIKRDYHKGILVYELHYNSEGFVPFADTKANLIKRITYQNNKPVLISIYDGYGRLIRTTK